MCGIFGIVGTRWRDCAERALAALAPRGPDAAGWYSRAQVTLGHRRLSIIDLATGAQPMTTRDGRYTIVLNGEIYNYKELRGRLQRDGFEFTTQSDTEVLLIGYVAWGGSLLDRLDGMYSFAIWDGVEERLFAARDRMGIKPFMYSTEGGFVFASTLQSFLAIEGFPRKIDYEALRDFLAFQTPLAPRTLLASVRQLPPAHRLEYHARTRRLEIEQYWSIPRPRPQSFDRDQLLERVDAAIAAAVKRQLVADVPIGAFLSGGIDSSLMVHYMAQAGANPLRTFSVRFAEASLDESAIALQVAQRYGTEHQVFDAPEIDADTFERAIGSLDQPLADPAYVPTCALSALARKHVTVAISGDGGDEVFGGYRRFLEREADFPPHAWQRPIGWLVSHGALPGALLRRTLSGRDLLLYRKVELGPYAVSRKSMRSYLSPEACQAARPAGTLERWTTLVGSFGGTIDSDALMRADLWTYLSENCLVKTDRASMAVGLEVRVPMLGNGVLDVALELPSAAHFQSVPGGTTIDKALLRGLAERHLPRAVWDRQKHGFSVPIGRYMRGAWRDRCEEWLGQSSTLAPYLQASAVRALWDAMQSGHGSARLAYTFVVLLGWLARNRLDA